MHMRASMRGRSWARRRTFGVAVALVFLVGACSSLLPSQTASSAPSASYADATNAASQPSIAQSTPGAVVPTPSGPSHAPVAVPTLPPRLLADAAAKGPAFPPGYGAYHTYAGMCAQIAAVARAHPDVVRVFSIGRSFEGRDIWAAQVSEDVGVDHGRPEILFDGLHHALEHMSLEMTLAILGWLADGYGTDPEVTRLLRERVVDIVFAVNPDGAEYDIAGGQFHGWRKNRQPNAGSASIGTDLNRNYDDHWGCCGLVSANPASPWFRGAAPFSAPETRAVADFVRSRIVDGRQRVRVAITFHTSGRLVLWPYGYTHDAVPPDMTADDEAVFAAMARAMASSNGYHAEQASGLYLDSGTARDWYYGRQHIFAFTFELGVGTYMPDSMIGPETNRNRAAVLYAIELAGCPYQAVGKQAQYCA